MDWAVVALDGVGLLFFFVPGVVAFAVDFATGAIYLPPTGYSRSTSRHPALVKRHTSRDQLHLNALSRFVSDHIDAPFALVPGEYQTQNLTSIDEFWEVNDAFESASS